MSRQPEGKIKDACRLIARRTKLLFYQIEGKGVNGIPDTLAGRVDGTACLIEFKTEHGVVGPQQEKRMAEIIAGGLPCFVCRSVDDYRKVVGL